MALSTVNEFIAQGRLLLQDTVTPYRHADTDYVAGLNAGLLEIRRSRPDLFIGVSSVPTYSAGATTVVLFEAYRLALLYFIAGYVQSKDDEEMNMQRAGAFTQRFFELLRKP